MQHSIRTTSCEAELVRTTVEVTVAETSEPEAVTVRVGVWMSV
jgi:hypothetical protein